MFSRNFLPSYPHKIAYLGVAILIAAALLSVGILTWMWPKSLNLVLEEKRGEAASQISPLSISLDLHVQSFPISAPKISNELICSFDCSRPDLPFLPSSMFVKIKKTSESKKVTLPCRLNLEFLDGEKLKFCDQASSFWVELNSSDGKKIEGKVFIETPLSEKIESESFCMQAQEPALDTSQDFLEFSPFRFLSEAKWLGNDKFREQYENGALYQSLEISSVQGSSLISLQEGDWLVWEDQRWSKKTLEDGKGLPIARIKGVQGKSLVLEGWEGDRHIYFGLHNNSVSQPKIKSEDFFTSVRIRSAKQISCMIEKQWLILKVGDWVLKTEGRWKVLKKKEERELYRVGSISGDLFVFEKVELKSGEKWIQGHLFSQDRSQSFFIQHLVPAHGMNKGKNELERPKGRPIR